jgi:hypothetical protein
MSGDENMDRKRSSMKADSNLPRECPEFPKEYYEYFHKNPAGTLYMFKGAVSESKEFCVDSHMASFPPTCFCMNDPVNTIEYIRKHHRNFKLVMEGLISTYPTAAVISSFKRIFDDIVKPELKDVVFPPEFEYASGRLCDAAVLSDDNEKVSPLMTLFAPAASKDDVDQLAKDFADGLRLSGYYLTSYAAMSEYECPGFLIVMLQFEAKYTNMLVDLADTLYYVAPLKHLPKILKNGLVPSSKSTEFKYKRRVYMFNRCKKELVYRYGIAKAVGSGDTGFCVFKVQKLDLLDDQLFKNGKQRLYLDPTFSLSQDCTDQTAVFTYGNVPLRTLSKQYVVVKLDKDRKVASEETRTF